MKKFVMVQPDVYRLVLPFRDIFTTVWVLKAPDGVVLFDTGTYDSDVDDRILPALEALQIAAKDLNYVFISHNHGDHAGGLSRLMERIPELTVVSGAPEIREEYGDKVLCPLDGDCLLDVYQVVSIPGHTRDSAALLDTRTGTLVTGDCLQLEGIIGSGDWAANIPYPQAYLQAIARLRQMDFRCVLTAHDYYPMGFRADGPLEIRQLLDACVVPLQKLQNLIRQNPELDDDQIRETYNVPNMPTMRRNVVAAMRQATEQGLTVEL